MPPRPQTQNGRTSTPRTEARPVKMPRLPLTRESPSDGNTGGAETHSSSRRQLTGSSAPRPLLTCIHLHPSEPWNWERPPETCRSAMLLCRDAFATQPLQQSDTIQESDVSLSLARRSCCASADLHLTTNLISTECSSSSERPGSSWGLASRYFLARATSV